ncbi:MAG: serine hydrolase [Clostridia bacterium]|nr:serine hydrolase [Clostridia bacterium]
MRTLFPKTTPEEVGISSENISALIQDFANDGLYMHSLLVIRHGKLAAEGYYAPFTRDTKHRLYSSSKTFAAGAIGLLYDEGKLSLDDKVHTFFPEFPADELHPYIKDATIRDLLTMSSPHVTTYSLSGDSRNATHWVESFFRTEPNRPAGTTFQYDTSSSYILNVIAERLAGKPMLEYMKDKMLRELGFSEDAWCVKSPDGYSWAGSGVICTPLDFATYAFILLRGGNVNGKQYMSEEYVKAATSRQVETDMFGCGGEYRMSGYGYQVWRTIGNGFLFSGMGSQLAYCLPEKDLLIVCTADTQGVAHAGYSIVSSMYNRIAATASDVSLPANPAAHAALEETLSTLTLYKPEGDTHSPMQEKINGVTYTLQDNPMGFKTVCFTFEGNRGTLHYENERGKKEIHFGLGEYVEGVFPESHYSGDTIGTPRGSGYRCLSVATWPTAHQLRLRVNIVDDYFGNLGMTFGFKGNQIGIISMKVAEGFLQDYIGRAGGETTELSAV